MASERDDHIKKIMDKGAGRSRAASGSRAVASGSGRGAVGAKTAGSRASSAGATRGVAAERVTRVVRASAPASNATATSASSKPSATRASAKVAGSAAAKSATAVKADQKGDKKGGVNSSNYPDRNVWISLVLLFVAGFLAICCASYLVYWSSDQDTVGFSKVFSGSGAAAENWGGPLGSTIANYVMGEWFGVFGLMLPLAVLIASIQVLRIPSLRLRMGVTSMLVLMLVGSVAMGHFFGVNTHAMGSGLGGGLGIMSAEWLNGVLGYWGTSLLIVLSGVGYTYFAAWPRMRVMMGRYRVWRDARRVRVAERQEFERVRRQEQMAKMAASRAEALERAAAAAARHKVIVGGNAPVDSQIDSHVDTHAETHDNVQGETQLRERLASSSVHIPAHSDVVVGTVAEAVSSAVSADAYSDSSAESLSSAVVEAPSFAGSYAPQPPFVVELEDGFYGYFMGYDAAGDAIVYRWMGGRGIASYSGSYTDSSVSSTAATGRYDSRVMQDDDDIEFTVRTRVEAVDSIELVADTSSHNTSTYTANYVPDYMDSPVVYAAAATATAAAAAAVEDKFVVEQAPEELQLEDHVINRTELYDPTLELGRYVKPPIELMDNHTRKVTVTDAELLENKNRIVNTLENFGIKIDTIEATIGPTVTLYEIIPAPGVRISKIKNLEDDIALALSALGIRIIAPIPGRGTIGIEVPNKDKEIVSMYSVIKSARFQESKAELPIAMGKTIENETFVLDLAKMPHLLVAGATGQGKSVGLNAIITSLLYKKHPAELKFILVDPKKVELTLYSRLEKHFLAKLPDAEEAIITDTQKVIYTLNSICIEMDARYDLLKMAKVRNIKEYNEKFINRVLNPNKGHRFLPYFVVIVDEFADLIMTAGREVETPIARIAQLARAVGIHLIIATQRPTTNIITGVIKANFPARIAFRVTSMIDSRTILDSPGANQLVGKGDMLISTGSEVTRVQCAFIDTPEVERIAEHIGAQQGYGTAYLLPEYVPEGEASSSSFDDSGKRDSLFEEVARYVVANDNGSASTIQRKFSIGFNRAGRLVDQLEAAGIVGRSEGSKPRQVLITDMSSLEFLLSDMN